MLRLILRLNAASCLLFGIVFVLLPTPTASFIGTSTSWLVTLVGVVLIFNGLHLLFSAQRTNISLWEVYYFSVGDFAWVVISIFLITTKLVITTEAGIVAALGVAFFVGTLGALQLWASKRADAPVL